VLSHSELSIGLTIFGSTKGKNLMRSSWLLMGTLVLSLAACDNNPGEGKTAATVNEPAPAAETAPTTPAPANAATYTFSAADSKIEFTGAKITGKHDGSFKTFNGTISVPEGKPELSQVKLEIDTNSLTVDPAKLEAHLKTPDFFDVAKYPKASFTSTAIAPSTDAGKTHVITGNLELHGVTKSISFPATVKLGADNVDADAEFVINRKDFGLVYPGMPDDLIKDEVLLKLQIRAKKAAST
jgi:polyisoprenoid-binding protein YceI